MADNPDKKAARGEHSVLGSKKEFKKDEARDASNAKKDEQAKDEIGHMGEASRRSKSAKDVR